MYSREERYSRVPQLLDTRYSTGGTKGKWRYASSERDCNAPPTRDLVEMRHLPVISIYGSLGG